MQGNLQYPESALRLLKDGEQKGLAYFFKRHCAKLCGFTIAIIGNKKETEAIVAKVFLQLWKQRETFETPTDLHMFLYYTTRDECFKLLEKNSDVTRVEKGSFYFDSTIELMLEVMLVVEKAEEKSIVKNLFTINFENPEITFKTIPIHELLDE